MIVKMLIDDWYPVYLESDDKESFSVEMDESELKSFRRAMKAFLISQQMIRNKVKEKENQTKGG